MRAGLSCLDFDEQLTAKGAGPVKVQVRDKPKVGCRLPVHDGKRGRPAPHQARVMATRSQTLPPIAATGRSPGTREPTTSPATTRKTRGRAVKAVLKPLL